jgi:hypothetical protein
VLPSGTLKAGMKMPPCASGSEQRFAISTVFSIASGRSAKSAAISAGDLRYCSGE